MRFTQFANLKGLALKSLAGLGLLAVSIVPVQSASAHYVYETGYMYKSSQDCVRGRSEVSHGNGNGYSKSDLTAEYRYEDKDCGDVFDRPSGYLKVRQVYQTHVAPGWGICRDTGWLYNTSPDWSMTVARTHSKTAGCGGWAAHTQSSMYEYNGSWKGGVLYSGDHNLPY